MPFVITARFVSTFLRCYVIGFCRFYVTYGLRSTCLHVTPPFTAVLPPARCYTAVHHGSLPTAFCRYQITATILPVILRFPLPFVPFAVTPLPLLLHRYGTTHTAIRLRAYLPRIFTCVTCSFRYHYCCFVTVLVHRYRTFCLPLPLLPRYRAIYSFVAVTLRYAVTIPPCSRLPPRSYPLRYRGATPRSTVYHLQCGTRYRAFVTVTHYRNRCRFPCSTFTVTTLFWCNYVRYRFVLPYLIPFVLRFCY